MKITITLTTAEENALRKYLANGSPEVISDKDVPSSEIDLEVKTRLYHALRDPREVISDYVKEEEKLTLAKS